MGSNRLRMRVNKLQNVRASDPGPPQANMKPLAPYRSMFGCGYRVQWLYRRYEALPWNAVDLYHDLCSRLSEVRHRDIAQFGTAVSSARPLREIIAPSTVTSIICGHLSKAFACRMQQEVGCFRPIVATGVVPLTECTLQLLRAGNQTVVLVSCNHV